MLFGPLLGHGSTPKEGRRGKKKTEKKKENVIRQVEEKNKVRCLTCLEICMYKYIFSNNKQQNLRIENREIFFVHFIF